MHPDMHPDQCRENRESREAKWKERDDEEKNQLRNSVQHHPLFQDVIKDSFVCTAGWTHYESVWGCLTVNLSQGDIIPLLFTVRFPCPFLIWKESAYFSICLPLSVTRLTDLKTTHKTLSTKKVTWGCQAMSSGKSLLSLPQISIEKSEKRDTDRVPRRRT
jgi:hypothetical protein